MGRDGRYPLGNFWTNSHLGFDELRVWTSARTQSQISGAMNACLSGNEAGLIQYTNFNTNISENISSVKGQAGKFTGYQYEASYPYGRIGRYYIPGADVCKAAPRSMISQPYTVVVNPTPGVNDVPYAYGCVGDNIALTATTNGTANWYTSSTDTEPVFTGNTFVLDSSEPFDTVFYVTTSDACPRVQAYASTYRKPEISRVDILYACENMPYEDIRMVWYDNQSGEDTSVVKHTGDYFAVYDAPIGGNLLSTSDCGYYLACNYNGDPLVATQNDTLYVESKTWDDCSSSPRVPLYLVIKTVPTLTVAVHDTSICGEGTIQLAAAANVGTVRWYDQPEYPWDLGSEDGYLGTGSTFTTPTIQWSTTLYVQASNHGCRSVGREEVNIDRNYRPALHSPVGASICPGAIAAISASGYDGEDINWYSSPSGGTGIGSGETFITPVLTQTKVYYAEAYDGTCPSDRKAATVMVYPVDTPTVKIERCIGSSYHFGNQTLTTAGTYTNTFTGIHGCDSTVTLNIAFVDTIRNRFTASFCENGAYQFGSKTLTAPGVYSSDTLTSAGGCDSIAILTLKRNILDSTYISASICNGEEYDFNGNTLTDAGVYYQTLTNTNGCDSVIVLNLNFLQNTSSTVVVSACNKYKWQQNNTTYTASGLYSVTIPNAAGCDSVITLNLTINSPSSATQTVSVCGSYTWPVNNVTYNASGKYKATILNATGCDSIITLNLKIKNPTSSAQTVAACNSYKWSLTNVTYTASGTYSKTLVNAAGCDSVVSLNLTIITPTSSSKSIAACGSYRWPLNNVTYSASGVYKVIIPNAVGCDSVITLNLTIKKATASTDVRTACTSFTWIDGITYSSSNNNATYVLPNAAGCDSVITLNLIINNPTTSSNSHTACGSYAWNGTTYSSSGTYSKNFTNSKGCDSTATLVLTINNATTSSTSHTACGSYAWNGTTYNSSGTYNKVLTNSKGCDSTATLILTINNATTSSTSHTACGSYAWNGTTYNSSGTYNKVLTNSKGCDSTATLILTINNATTSSTSHTACGSYAWNGTTYNSSGTYNKVLTNSKGCDSTATLILTINNATTSSTSHTACGSYAWNGTTYNSSGTYNKVLTNSKGCDSTATLILTINNATTSSTSHTACGSYTWNGTTYMSSGTYTKTLTNTKGCDSTATLILTINNATTSSASHTACGSYAWNGTMYNSSGTYNKVLTNSKGCDSTATLILTINNATTSSTSHTACGSYTWNGTTYMSSGTYTKTLTNSKGCDSTATLNLTINKGSSKDTTITACKSVTFMNVNYTSSATFTQTLVNAANCDSIVTYHINIENGTTSVPVIQNGPKLTADIIADSYQWLDCNKGNSAIAGATSAMYTAQEEGSFAVAVKIGSCTDISSCSIVTVTDITEAGNLQTLVLYPNPTSNKVTLSFGSLLSKAELEICNSFGQVVLTTSLMNIQEKVLDLETLANGVYMLCVRVDGQLMKRRVIVQK